MLEQLIYKNHLNEIFEFGADGIFVNESDLHDYEWDVTTKNNRISAFSYKVRNLSLPVIIICETAEQGIAARNKLFEIVEKDVLAKEHGQIILGGYYFRCFVTKSKKKRYLTSNRYMELTLTLSSDYPVWVKETTHNFSVQSSDEETAAFLDYPIAYPFDYYSNRGSTELNNTSVAKANFRMIIYGACVNPVVYIAGHAYCVNCTVAANEYIQIDSTTKTIKLIANNGTETNVFNLRSRDSYIFEEIPAGIVNVSWDGSFAFDVILLEERSEPKWT